MNNVSTEPVTIVLKDGRRFGRLITFTDGNKLNALREKNEEYNKAVRTLAPFDSICFKDSYSMFAPEFSRINEVLKAYYEEVGAERADSLRNRSSQQVDGFVLL